MGERIGNNIYIKRLNISFFIILLLFAILLFYNLDNKYLDQDYAETALLANSILKYGVPKTDLGNNRIVLTGPQDSNEFGLWTWHTWGQYYLVACSFLIFGKSTFSSKLPFVIIAFISLFLIKHLYDEMYHNKKITNLSLLLMLLGTTFMTYSRTCRYYSIQFLTIPYMILIFYRKLIGKEKRYDHAIFILLNIMLFHFNYAPFIIINFVFFVFILKEICLENKNFSKLIYLIKSWIIIAIFTVPWLVVIKPWEKNNLYPWGVDFINSIYTYLSETNLTFCFLLLIIIIFYFVKTKSFDSKKEFLSLFIIVPIVFLLIFPLRYFRYLLGFLPIYYLFISIFLKKVWSKNKMIAIILLLLILTTFFSSIPYYLTIKSSPGKIVFNSLCENMVADNERCDRGYILFTEDIYLYVPIIKYVLELTTENKHPLKWIVQYLNKYSKENDIVFTNYDLSPMMFYTNLTTYYVDIQKTDHVTPNWIIPRDEGYLNKIMPILDMYKKKCEVIPITLPYPKQFWNNRIGLVNQTMYQINCKT